MRSNPAQYQLIAPATLGAVVSLLAEDPGTWTPIAGGTDVMVQYAAGKLAPRKLVSIWNLPELRRVEILPEEIRIGAGCTYTDISTNASIRHEFPLLQRVARWTGGIANQNRGPIGGNIVNASPAADSLPALLVYDAELILISARGERRVPYSNFHTAYKKTLLAPDELIRTVCLPRRLAGYFSYARKVGARNAQAISKVCIAAVGHMKAGVVEDVRIALGSVAPIPHRLRKTEQALRGRAIDLDILLTARRSVAAEIQPIDDIRSTARYRSVIAGNLLVEFLTRWQAEQNQSGSAREEFLSQWNRMPTAEAVASILPCCGSQAWALKMAARRPIEDESGLLIASHEIWRSLNRSDWMEAFRSHPRIGESKTVSVKTDSSTAQSVEWSANEQRDVQSAESAVKAALAEANREYERRFNRIFIVFATGKSAPEILGILRRRLQNDPETELQEAAEQQRQITAIRLRKWIQG
jgi:OHCU decarboxylase